MLHNTAGVTFQAAEGGEEDIRLRGFSLAATGDIFVDGMRDPAFYERDTFNHERIELLRGSASMLFGRGSTGGVVNQVNKQPQLVDETRRRRPRVGSGSYLRVTGDFNCSTGENAALRINAMVTHADNNGNSASDKQGIAPTFRWGIGTRRRVHASASTTCATTTASTTACRGSPRTPAAASSAAWCRSTRSNYYAPASDYNAGSASYVTFSHLHRFGDGGGQLKTVVARGPLHRDQRASAIRFYIDADPRQQPDRQPRRRSTR